jgi:hypothetical protein
MPSLNDLPLNTVVADRSRRRMKKKKKGKKLLITVIIIFDYLIRIFIDEKKG